MIKWGMIKKINNRSLIKMSYTYKLLNSPAGYIIKIEYILKSVYSKYPTS